MENYTEGTHVLINHKLGISLGEIISVEAARAKLKEGTIVPEGKIPVLWGACISSFIQWFTPDELDQNQREVTTEPNYGKAIREFMERKGSELKLAKIHKAN